MENNTSTQTTKLNGFPKSATSFSSPTSGQIKKTPTTDNMKLGIIELPTYKISLSIGDADVKVLKYDRPRFDALLLPSTKEEKTGIPFFDFNDKGQWDLKCGRDHDKFVYWGKGRSTKKMEINAFKELVAELTMEYNKNGIVLMGNKYRWDARKEHEIISNYTYLKTLKKAA